MVVGKVVDPWKSGYFPKDGVEHWSDTYELLCGGYTSWQYKTDKYLIEAGKGSNSEIFYICQATFEGNKIPGKYYKPTDCCYIAANGREHCVKEFWALSFCCNMG
jgi:hypothetical protein